MNNTTGQRQSRKLQNAIALSLLGILQVSCERAQDSNAPQRAASGSQTSPAPQHVSASVGTPTSSQHASPERGHMTDPGSSDLATVLSAVVSDDGYVKYDLLDESELLHALDSSIQDMAQAVVPVEAQANSRKALWINAFNANTMRMAWTEKQREGFVNVHDIPGFFDVRSVMVCGEHMTLHELRDRLRGLGDPRIHAALVYAARGSPALRSRPYTAMGIDRELDDAALHWLEDMRHNRAARDGLWLSPIFEKFADDFEVQPYEGVLGFVRKHARPNSSLRDFVRSVDDLRIRHRPFDWSLNQANMP